MRIKGKTKNELQKKHREWFKTGRRDYRMNHLISYAKRTFGISLFMPSVKS